MNYVSVVPADLDAILIVGAPNLYYYSGFINPDAAILLLKNKGYYITDRRYTEEAKEKVTTGLEILLVNSGETYISSAVSLLKSNSCATLGIEERSLSVDEYNVLRAVSDLSLRFISDVLMSFRVIKKDYELVYMREAQRITEIAFDYALGIIKEGMTELALARELESKLIDEGADDIAFKSIVAFGENTSRPHAVRGKRALKTGDLITIDFGAKYYGYCSDMTRTFAFGSITEDKKRVYEIVLDAQKRAIDVAHVGMKGMALDAVCRDCFDSYGFKDNFVHSTGHGLGIEIHEGFSIGQYSFAELKENMVFSIEPGLYFEGEFGVRIEDVITLTKNGADNLTNTPKELIIL